jgi:hypothetical protein
MHPDRPTGQKIGRNSDVRRRLLPAEHAAAEGLRRPGSEPNRRASKGSADSDTYEYPLGLAEMTFLPRLPTEAYYRPVSMLLGQDVEK